MTSSQAAGAGRSIPAFPEFVTLIALMMGLTALSIDIMLPALPDIDAAFRIADANDRQLVVSAYLFGFAVGQLVYGPVSDRFGRKPALLFGLAIYALASLGTVLATEFSGLLLARAIQGIGCAAPRVIAIAAVRDIYGGRQMARVMSFVMMVFIIVPILAPSIGEALLVVGEWEWIFLFLLVVSLILMVWAASRLPETRLPGDREPLSWRWLGGAVWQTVSTTQTLGYTVATGIVFGALLGYINSAQQIFIDIYDVGSLFPILFGVIAVALAGASFLNSRFVERHGMRRLSHSALCGFVVVATIHAGVALAVTGPPPLLVFCGLLAANLFFFGLLMPNFNALAMEPLGRIAGTASSFVGAFTTGWAALGGWYIGQQYNGTVLPLTIGYVVLGCLALAVIMVTERGRLFRPQHG